LGARGWQPGAGLILELWGPDRGQHARSASALAELPFRVPVEIEAEVLLED
jgi:hypothetical protein